jgi:hypothetical protein
MSAVAVPAVTYGASASVVGTITVVAVGSGVGGTQAGVASVDLTINASGILSYVPDWDEAIVIRYENSDVMVLLTEDVATFTILLSNEQSITLKTIDEGTWE